MENAEETDSFFGRIGGKLQSADLGEQTADSLENGAKSAESLENGAKSADSFENGAKSADLLQNEGRLSSDVSSVKVACSCSPWLK